MKISSASKKVLASALSAAMVVAFAPTVAFGAPANVTPAKYVSVTFNGNGSSTTAPAPAYKQVKQYDGKYYIEAADTYKDAAGKDATADGYSFDKWFIDADGDGVIDEGEAYAKTVNGATNMVEISADATSVELKAAYATPSITKLADSAFSAVAAYGQSTEAWYDAKASKIAFTVANPGLADHKYVLTVTNPAGTVVGTETFGSGTGESDPVTELAGNKAVFFTDNALSSDKWAAYKSNLVAGDYTVTLTDNGKEISAQKITLATITVTVGSKTKSGLGQVKGTADLRVINPIADTDYQAYTDAEGYYVADPTAVAVKGDAAYTAVEQATTITVAPAYDETNRQLTFTVANAAAAGAKFDVTVKAPSGVVYTGHANGAYIINFDQTSKNDRTSAAEEAGDYIVTATITEANGTVKTASAKMTLTELKVEAGEGTKVVTANKAQVKSYFTDVTTEAGLATFVGTVEAAVNPGTNSGADDGIVAKDANATLTWKLNGADIVSANKVKAGQTNILTATTAAVNYAAAPEYSVAKVAVTGQADQYVLTVAPAAGTTVAVTDGTNAINKATDGKYNVTGKDTVVITATGAAGTTAKVITLAKLGTTMSDAWKAATKGGQSALEKNIGNTTTKWLAADGVKGAIESGKAAIDAYEAKYYAVVTEGEAIEVAAYKALYEAVAAEADAQIKAYENGAKVVAGSKVYSMTADQYAAAVKAVDTAKKAVETAVKNAGTDSATVVAKYKEGFDTSNDSVLTVTNTRLTGENFVTVENYTAADVKAAQEVSASLKAATTGAEAEAALKAFDALTAAQKELVAAADLAAAQKVADEAKAQAELIVAQDDAAVSKARNASKTVKAGKAGKTTKKASITLKKITSASGAKVTYKKSSGKKAITVKSGKAYLAKGTKVGKYTATIKATCGTQTAKIKVTFKVVK